MKQRFIGLTRYKTIKDNSYTRFELNLKEIRAMMDYGDFVTIHLYNKIDGEDTINVCETLSDISALITYA